MPKPDELDLERYALIGLETEKDRIEHLIQQLRGRSTPNGASSTPRAGRKRRPMSAEARKRIGDATRKRWAEQRRQKKQGSRSKSL